uniref:Uncharacterized protein n=1 Tax=Anguilla anguilla TaxID=7936 RepID=A0A0E9QKU2_ANGAN
MSPLCPIQNLISPYCLTTRGQCRCINDRGRSQNHHSPVNDCQFFTQMEILNTGL